MLRWMSLRCRRRMISFIRGGERLSLLSLFSDLSIILNLDIRKTAYLPILEQNYSYLSTNMTLKLLECCTAGDWVYKL